MQDVIRSLIQPLVEFPNELRVTGINGKATYVYELRCNQKDVGKIIGKKGKTISAVRTLLNAIASREGKKAVLEVVE